MGSEAPRKPTEKERLQRERDWLQTKLKEEVALMQEAVDRDGHLEHASKVCAYIEFAPRGFHVEIELTSDFAKSILREPRLAKFVRRVPDKTAIRRYLQVGVTLGDSQLSLRTVPDFSGVGFKIQEIAGRMLGVEKKLGLYDLHSASVVETQPLAPKTQMELGITRS